MCALLDEAAQQQPEKKGNRKKTFLIFFVIILIGMVTVELYTRFTKPDLPEAVTILVDPDPAMKGVLPHEVDPATEFENSFETLAEGAVEPEYRDTGEAVVPEVVKVEAPVEEEPSGMVVSSKPTQPEPPAVESKSEDLGGKLKDFAANTFGTGNEKATGGTEKPLEGMPTVPGKDWNGIVLVPDRALLSKAYTSDVSLIRIEAHPLNNDRLRVWARIRNETSRSLGARISCNFRSTSDKSASTSFIPVKIPHKQSIDVYFVSPISDVKAYTVLVK